MLEEILNSVRALSNMISEQGWSTLGYLSHEKTLSLEDLARAYRSRALGGIGSGSTGPIGLDPSEALRLAAQLVYGSASPSPSPSPPEEPPGGKKKTE